MLTKGLEHGDLYIFDDVIKLITKMAISEIGDVECSSSLTKNKLFNTLKGHYGNISILSKEEEVTVDISVGIVFGENIPETINKLQRLIKSHIEMFTGFKVAAVNVSVNQVLIKD